MSAASDVYKRQLINTAGNLWLESQNRYAEFIAGMPPIVGMHRNDDSAATAVSHLGDMRDNFGKGYFPTGMKNYNTKGFLLDTSLSTRD